MTKEDREQKEFNKAMDDFAKSFEPTLYKTAKSSLNRLNKKIMDRVKQKLSKKNNMEDEIDSKKLQRAIDNNNKEDIEKRLIKDLQIDLVEAANGGKSSQRRKDIIKENEGEINLIYFDNHSVIYSANYFGGSPSAYMLEKGEDGKYRTNSNDMFIDDNTKATDILQHFNKSVDENSAKEIDKNFQSKDVLKSSKILQAAINRRAR